MLLSILLILLPAVGHMALTPQTLLAAEEPLQPAPAIPLMVELQDSPAVLVYAAQQEGPAAAAVTATQMQLAKVTSAQAALQQQLADLDVPVLYSVQRVYNGVAVLADEKQRKAISEIPGVAAVHILSPKEPGNAVTIPFLGIPTLWQAAPAADGVAGVRGEGMRIAIIDTGIDYLHRDFGGPGAGYRQNDHTRVGDVDGYPGPRVVGGYDFVGDDYNAAAGATASQLTPQPDPDPMDCYGHGTHVAGTAAGSGVNADKSTYSGPYDSTLRFDGMLIGPGVAPRASIYALKIFGCYGSTNATELALEWTVDPNQDGDFSDHMDVANLSLGSAYGWKYDSSAVAADNAALAGVIVVASAGNSGNLPLITGAPAIAERAISVAATQRASDMIAGFSARGPRRGDAVLKPDLAAPGTSIISAANGSGWEGTSASGTSMAAPHVSGLMVLLRQLHPDWRVEELKALAMNTAMPLVRTTDALTAAVYLPVRTGAGRIDPQAAARTSTLAYAAPGSGRVSISFGAPAVTDFYTATQDVVVANKSVTDVWYEITYNSLVDMPGVHVQTPVEPLYVRGNEIAHSPITLQVEAAKLERVQAESDRSASVTNSWLAEESGHIYLWPVEDPVTVQMVANGSPIGSNIASATFTYQPQVRTLVYTITLASLDISAITSATLGLGRPGEASIPLAILGQVAQPQDFTTSRSVSGSVMLDSAGERWLAAGMLHLRLAVTGAATGEARGQLLFAQPVLHLPLYAAPYPIADMRAEQRSISFITTTVQTLTLTGRSVQGAMPPRDVVALANVLELKLRSPNTRPAWLPPNAPDVYDHADIKYVGITSDLDTQPATSVEEAKLYFGVATWGAWSTPSEIKVTILLDLNNDGKYDYRLINGSPSAPFFGVGPSSPLVSQLYDLSSGRLVGQEPLNGMQPEQFDAGLFFSNVLVLPVKIADLDFGAGVQHFSFIVISSSSDSAGNGNQPIDTTPILRYAIEQPALHFRPPPATAPLYLDQQGATIEVQANPAGYPYSPPGGVLILHHHNSSAAQAEVVDVAFRWPASIYLPAIIQRSTD